MKVNRKKYLNLKFPFFKKRDIQQRDEIKLIYSMEIQALLDIEEVENDPMFQTTDEIAKKIVSDFNHKSEKNTKNREFIAETLNSASTSDDMIAGRQREKVIITRNNVNEISAGLVNKWMDKNKNPAEHTPNADKNAEFIKKALNKDSKPEVEKHSIKRRYGSKISQKIVVTGLSVAALLTVFFMIKSLLPGNNSEEIFSKYYRPFDAITPVSRNSNSNLNLMLTEGISFYKSGEYQSALLKFNDVIAGDSSLIAPSFFAGLTQIELGNFSDAVSMLSKVSARLSEYKYEAKWYLGLSYLKAGDKSNAISCFEFLSENSEFYMERARKILHSLKK
jgi:TolA-binding protein